MLKKIILILFILNNLPQLAIASIQSKIINNLIHAFIDLGNLSLELRKKGLKKKIKSDNTSVTNADIEINDIITKKISNLTVVNNEIFLFSSKGYLLSFNSKNGKINSVNRILKSGLGNRPIFANGYMYLFDKNYKLFKYN